jgi:hypothetical protein
VVSGVWGNAVVAKPCSSTSGLGGGDGERPGEGGGELDLEELGRLRRIGGGAASSSLDESSGVRAEGRTASAFPALIEQKWKKLRPISIILCG